MVFRDIVEGNFGTFMIYNWPNLPYCVWLKFRISIRVRIATKTIF